MAKLAAFLPFQVMSVREQVSPAADLLYHLILALASPERNNSKQGSL